jgi:DNA-binding IclR family transcriptional regulator
MLRHFLQSCIDSVEQLETLIAIAESSRGWTVSDLCRATKMSPEVARTNLEALVSRGLLRIRVTEPSTYHYQPRSAELAAYVHALVVNYQPCRSTIARLVVDGRRLRCGSATRSS